MLRRLRERSTALLLAVVIVALSVLLGSNISLNRLRREAESVYTMGADNNWRGISHDLTQVIENANNMITISERYIGRTTAAVSAVEKGIDGLYAVNYYNAPTGAARAANQLREALDALDTELQGLALDDYDERQRVKLMADINSSYMTIERSPYNDAAGAFNDTLREFPANIFSGITGVKPLPLYE